MTVLYVREQGARICRNGEKVRVMQKGKILHELAVRELDQVVVYGNVQLTTQAAALLVSQDVDVVFYSQHGRFRYRLVQTGARYARLHQAQLRMVEDERRSLAVAQTIVVGKLHNQAALLTALAGGMASVRAVAEGLTRAAAEVRQMQASCAHATTPDGLRGFEGRAGAIYFGAMQTLVPPSWGFRGRAYHPPPDPWNATLSFGYSLLLKDVAAAVQLVGLDPYVGFFHALEANRPSLVLDLMEEFRPLVDAMCLELLAADKLPLAQYRRLPDPEQPVLMGPQLVPVLITAWEKRLEQTVRHVLSGEQTSMRRCLELQARQMAAVIVGQATVYRPQPLVFEGGKG